MADSKRVRSSLPDRTDPSRGALRRIAPAVPDLAVPGAPRARPAGRETAVPSAAGTAVLNLSPEQTQEISVLLIAMRTGKRVAADVRARIHALLSGDQRRAVGSAYFILSVWA